MAKKIIPETISNRNSVQGLHQNALGILDELNEEHGKVYAVASAGRAFVGEAAVTENHLFAVIETMCENVILINLLRTSITELAELSKGAGLSIETGV